MKIYKDLVKDTRQKEEFMRNNNDTRCALLHIFVATLISTIISMISFMIFTDIVDKIIVSLIGFEIIFFIYNPIRHVIKHGLSIVKLDKFIKDSNIRIILGLGITSILIYIRIAIKDHSIIVAGLLCIIAILLITYAGIKDISDM